MWALFMLTQCSWSWEAEHFQGLLLSVGLFHLASHVNQHKHICITSQQSHMSRGWPAHSINILPVRLQCVFKSSLLFGAYMPKKKNTYCTLITLFFPLALCESIQHCTTLYVVKNKLDFGFWHLKIDSIFFPRAANKREKVIMLTVLKQFHAIRV